MKKTGTSDEIDERYKKADERLRGCFCYLIIDDGILGRKVISEE